MLRVRVLGGLLVEGLDSAALGSRKQRRLLARLAVADGAAVSFDALIDDLWDVSPPASPRDQLAVLVSRLRSALEGSLIHRSDAGYALDLDWCDLPAFAERQREAVRRSAEGQWPAAAEAGRAAIALLRGPLLPELEADWVVQAQASLDREAQEVRRVLAQAELAVGEPRRAADLAGEALRLAPYDEVALRLHLQACLAAGSPALGLATYAEAVARLADDLGVDPSAETRSAYEQLLEATAAPSPAAHRSTPLAGRAAELLAVDQLIESAAQGRGGLLVLTGEPGIGKSRVLIAAAAVSGVRVLQGTCDQLGRVLPLQPVLDALRDELRGRSARESEQLLGDDAGLLAPTLGLALTVSGTGLPDGGTGQLLLQAAVLRVLDRLAADEVVLLVIDDGHLADAATLALLSGLTRRPSRVAALVGARSGAGPAWPESALRELGPLDLRAVAEVVGPENAEVLHQRSGGHPLLLQEIAAAPDHDVPATLRAAFAAAADSAGRAGATLRAASIVGPDLDLDVLSQVLQRPAVELLDDLEEGVRRRLLVESTSGFSFRHALVREALAADVGPTRVALLHRETARALAARPTVDPLVLAHHAHRGELPDVAAAALARAGEIAASRCAHDEALRLAQEALREVPDNVSALLVQARALLVLGRYVEAASAAARAASSGAGPAALQVGALAAHYMRDWTRATELADAAAAQTEDVDVRAASLAIAAHALHAQGSISEAQARWAQAGTGLSRTPSGWLALLRHHQGFSEETLRLTEGADLGSGIEQLALPLTQMARGLAFAALGRSGHALESFAATEELVQRLAIARYAGRADNCRGYVLRNLGELSLADELNSAAREAGEAIGHDEPVAHAVLDLAEGRLRHGDLGGAAALLEQAAAYGSEDRRHSLQWRHRIRAVWLQGRLLRMSGDLDGAGDCAERVLKDAESRELARYAAFGQLLLLQVRLDQGSQVEPEAILGVTERLTTLAGLELPWMLADVARSAEGAVRTALLYGVRLGADRLVASAPADLKPAVQQRIAALLG